MKNVIKCRSNHNCNTFDDDPIGSLFDFKWRTKKNNIDYEKVNLETIDIEALKKLQLLNSYIPESNNYSSTLQDAKNNILYYIVGYLIRKLNLDCSSCENAVLNKFNEHDYCKSLSFISKIEVVLYLVLNLCFYYTRSRKNVFIVNR